jgi:translation initiation factor 2-alpha kinase 4
MMLELAQHIQVFLHKHDRPPVSLYEEMVERQRAEERREREREEKERQLSRIKEEEQVLATVSERSLWEPGAA